jgi:hypothetical protein
MAQMATQGAPISKLCRFCAGTPAESSRNSGQKQSAETVVLPAFLLVCLGSDYVGFFGLEDCSF